MQKILLTLISLAATLLAYSQNLNWAYAPGSTSPDVGQAIESDLNGNVFTTGYFQNIIDFDPGAANDYVSSYGGEDIFITKYDQNGNYQWTINIGGSLDDRGFDLKADANGNIYVIGYIQGTVFVDPLNPGETRTSNGGRDILVAKYDQNGAFLFAHTFGSATHDEGYGIDVDASGNIAITGMFTATADFDPGVGTAFITSNGNYDVIVAKYSATMTYQWGFNLGGPGVGIDIGEEVKMDLAGNVYVTGSYKNTVDFDPGTGTASVPSNNNSYDFFVAKYDPLGNYQWAKGIGGSSTERAYALDLASNGDIVVAGYMAGVVDFDPSAGNLFVTSQGSSDGFLASYDGTGNLNWAFNLGSSAGNDYAYDLEVDASDNSYVTGVFTGACDFDPGATSNNLISSGSEDVYISKYDVNGNNLYAFSFGGSISDYGYGIDAALSSGTVHATGYFRGVVDFDPGSGTTSYTAQGGSVDIYIAQYDECAPLSSTQSASICQGDSLFVGGDYQFTSGSYYDTLLGSNGCDSIVETVLTVNSLPSISGGPDLNICTGDSVTLSGTGGNTYVWTNGVLDGVTFAPAATATYTVTGTALNGCVNTDQVTVTVNSIPSVQMLPFNPDNVCLGSSPVTVPGAIPSGGTYWGTGVSGGMFDPNAAGVGTFNVYYDYTDGNGCSNSDSTSITVNDLPTVQIDPFGNDTICIDAGQMSLPAGSPSGGTYSGTGVIGGYFDPVTSGAGSFDVIYTYTDGNMCTNSDTTSIAVNALPVVQLDPFNNDTICNTDATISLPAGTPVGGGYTGTGVVGNDFDPAVSGVGTFDVVYTYTDQYGCENSDTATIVVANCSGLEELNNLPIQVYPNPTEGKFTIATSESIPTELTIRTLDGRMVRHQEFNTKVLEVDLSDEVQGVYLLHLVQNNKEATVRVVVL